MNRDLIMFFLSADQPRRIKVIENTLIQRRTVSILFWGMRYGINDFMGCLPKVDSQYTLSELQKLINAGLVKQPNDKHYLLTEAGVAWVHNHFANYNSQAGLKMNLRFDLNRFRRRFLLATQVVSEYSYHNNQYYPMLIGHYDDQFIKRWFNYFKDRDLVKNFSKALINFLSQLSDQRAWQFTKILNGHSIIGMTIFQQANELNLNPGVVWINELQLFNELIEFLIKNSDRYQAPYLLLGEDKRSLVSNSAKSTYQMLLSGNSFDQIAQIRHIKASTVKEHLLEVAILEPQTSELFKKLFNELTWQRLEATYHGNIDQWQFNDIKKQDPTLDYFYFRLYQILRGHLNG